MDSTITRLLVATKQLLEGEHSNSLSSGFMARGMQVLTDSQTGLARWARGDLSEDAISEIYVKLGNDFNLAVAAFAKENIGMSELLSVPGDLRICLETCLSEEPSQATLERHLPKVRQIIIGLLHGLREKQRLYRDNSAARRVRETQEREQARAKQLAQLQQAQKHQQQANAPASGGGGSPPTGSGAGPSDRGSTYSVASSTGSSSATGHPSTRSLIGKEPLSPDSATRSRDDLRRFVSQAQQQHPPPTASTSQSLPGTRSTSPLPPPLPGMALPALPSTSGSRSRPSLESQASLSNDDLPRDGTRQSAIPLVTASPKMVKSNSNERDSYGTSEAEFGTLPSVLPSSDFRKPSSSGSLRRRSSERLRAHSPPPPPRDKGPMPLPMTPTHDTSPINDFPTSPRTSFPDPTNGLTSAPPSVPVHYRRPSAAILAAAAAEPPPPPPAGTMAHMQSLEALRQSDNLSRRASRRFSAYAIQKITTGSGSPGRSPGERRIISGPSPMGAGSGGGGSGDPGDGGSSLPRSASAGRELANADERGGMRRGGPTNNSMTAPARKAKSEFRPTRGGTTVTSPLAQRETAEIATIAEEGTGGSREGSPSADSSSSPSRNGVANRTGSMRMPPPTADLPATPSSSSTFTPSIAEGAEPTSVGPVRNASTLTTVSTDSDSHDYPLTVFLQIGREVKKARLVEEPTIASLKLVFVERFQYNPGANDFPAIYVRDGEFGISYELEDMKDVRNGSVLSLNIDTVEQVKQHIDQGLLTLSQDIKELRSTMTAMRRVSSHAGMFSPELATPAAAQTLPEPSEQQYQDAAQKVLRMRRLGSIPNMAASANADKASPSDPNTPKPSQTSTSSVGAPPLPAAPKGSPTLSTSSKMGGGGGKGALDANQVVETLRTQHKQVQDLRRELGVLRQVYSDFGHHTKHIFAAMKVETSRVHKLASTSKVGKSRTFVEAGVQKLDADVSELVVKVDEISDSIELMRADVVRGVRPRPGYLSETALTLKKIVEQRDAVAEKLGTTKPTWAHTWSEELAKVLGEQETVQKHESMLVDLCDDLNDVKDVLKNIEAVAKSTKKLHRTKSGHRLAGSGDDGTEGNDLDPGQSLSNVLLEVKHLQPDANRRLEAIARAEKQREIDNANRTDEFADELEEFVQGSKLKKSGGVEEAERLRQARSEATLKAMFAG
ncbi:BQ5605_C002g01606 [Microbotryum silenes-dioicae]|uniref:BQ5605_C002g01606 protein n=1 Tax=Microbotryum silenes-dioicae TaxID=796604 RepID=A0A2X0LZ70_9BASI|nr:BQ5605_C002g01606 [Microbotryum silenes-dioicae]